MTFQLIARPVNLSHDTARAIEQAIREGRFKVGDKLPSEAKLAVSFGVSRGIVREAVARLKSLGLVESIQGSGLFVCRSEALSEFRVEPMRMMQRQELQQVFELRLELEMTAVALAARRRTRRDLGRLRAALAELARNLEQDEPGYDPDYGFHVAIAEASANAYLRDLLAYVTTQMSESVAYQRRRNKPSRAVLTQVHREHEAVLRAIEIRDADTAMELTRGHLLSAAERLGLEPARLGRGN